MLEASEDGRPRWTADLGPAVVGDSQVLEVGELTIARVGPELIAVATDDGVQRWRQLGWGSVGEKGGLYGCSRCQPPSFYVRYELDHLILSGAGSHRWANVFEPTDGQVLARLMWD